MRPLAGTFCKAIAKMTQLRALNLVKFSGLTAQHVKEHLCCLTNIQQLGLQYDFDTEPPASEEWDRETQDWIEVPSEANALSVIADRMLRLRSFTLHANVEKVERTVLPWLECQPGLFHLRHLAFVLEDPHIYAEDTWELMERVAAAREDIQCAWHRVKEGLRVPFVGEL
jgi:hypothetical protein